MIIFFIFICSYKEKYSIFGRDAGCGFKKIGAFLLIKVKCIIKSIQSIDYGSAKRGETTCVFF